MNEPRRSVWVTILIIAMFLAAYILAVNLSHAEPPPGAHDPVLGKWFQSLQQPGTGWMCCSISDCRNVTTRIRGGHIEAFVDRKSFGAAAPDDWVVVPENVMIRGKENPTGEPTLCFYGGQVRCFVDASGT